MNNSQLYASIALVCTILSSICAGVLPQIQSLGVEYKFYGTILSIIIAVCGAVVTAVNQSLNPNHVSIPKKKAERLGISDKSKPMPPRNLNTLS